MTDTSVIASPSSVIANEHHQRHCERSEAIPACRQARSLGLLRRRVYPVLRYGTPRNDVLDSFRIWLKSHNYSGSTIRNYLADIGRYQAYVIANTSPVIASEAKQSHQDRHVATAPRDDALSRDVARYVSTKNSNDNSSVIAKPRCTSGLKQSQLDRHIPQRRDDVFLFDSEIPKSYILSIQADPNYHRYLSSLNKFCQFALDQQLITSNPVKKILRQIRTEPRRCGVDDLLKQYQTYLTKKNKTPVTIKNYINDIQQYIRFCQNPSVIAGPFSVIASEHRERGNLNPMGLLRRRVYPVLRYGAPRNDAPRDDITQ